MGITIANRYSATNGSMSDVEVTDSNQVIVIASAVYCGIDTVLPSTPTISLSRDSQTPSLVNYKEVYGSFTWADDTYYYKLRVFVHAILNPSVGVYTMSAIAGPSQGFHAECFVLNGVDKEASIGSSNYAKIGYYSSRDTDLSPGGMFRVDALFGFYTTVASYYKPNAAYGSGTLADLVAVYIENSASGVVTSGASFPYNVRIAHVYAWFTALPSVGRKIPLWAIGGRL